MESSENFDELPEETKEFIRNHENYIRNEVIDFLKKNEEKSQDELKSGISNLLQDELKNQNTIKHGPIKIHSVNDDGSMLVSAEVYLPFDLP